MLLSLCPRKETNMKLITGFYRPIGSIKEAASVYPEGDCCYGCPYRCCPNRPDNAFRERRPGNCIWSIYLRISRKGNV